MLSKKVCFSKWESLKSINIKHSARDCDNRKRIQNLLKKGSCDMLERTLLLNGAPRMHWVSSAFKPLCLQQGDGQGNLHLTASKLKQEKNTDLHLLATQDHSTDHCSGSRGSSAQTSSCPGTVCAAALTVHMQVTNL